MNFSILNHLRIYPKVAVSVVVVVVRVEAIVCVVLGTGITVLEVELESELLAVAGHVRLSTPLPPVPDALAVAVEFR